ncbi:MAG TPA: hypothetical protein V6D23_21545, partial [Candidatus Obscuribacterales bacterium]
VGADIEAGMNARNRATERALQSAIQRGEKDPAKLLELYDLSRTMPNPELKEKIRTLLVESLAKNPAKAQELLMKQLDGAMQQPDNHHELLFVMRLATDADKQHGSHLSRALTDALQAQPDFLTTLQNQDDQSQETVKRADCLLLAMRHMPEQDRDPGLEASLRDIVSTRTASDIEAAAGDFGKVLEIIQKTAGFHGKDAELTQQVIQKWKADPQFQASLGQLDEFQAKMLLGMANSVPPDQRDTALISGLEQQNLVRKYVSLLESTSREDFGPMSQKLLEGIENSTEKMGKQLGSQFLAALEKSPKFKELLAAANPETVDLYQNFINKLKTGAGTP